MVTRRPEHFSAERNRTQIGKPGIGESRIDVVRAGRTEPLFPNTEPVLSATPLRWGGIAIEKHATPPLLIPRHEHPDHFLHMVIRGSVPYGVNTRGKYFQFHSRPGTLFMLPRGTVDEVNWMGEVERVALSIVPRVLVKALEETAHLNDIELTEHWGLFDHHISTLVAEMVADLDEESPAGVMYGESLANALSVYLLKRYAVWPVTPIVYKGGMPRYRLKRVLEFIAENLDRDLTLPQLALIAGMSPHYFSELFKQSTGHTPHRYLLLQRLDRAKRQLREGKHSIIEIAHNTGFENPSHFSRVFRQLEGASPSRYRADFADDAA